MTKVWLILFGVREPVLRNPPSMCLCIGMPVATTEGRTVLRFSVYRRQQAEEEEQ